MTRIEKSNLMVNGDTVRVSMPFAKVDKQNRLVSGWATLDNIDTQGDVVLAEASAKAFKRAKGNIREMHQPLAVGRMVDFKEDEFYDANDKKFYRGIFVTARVSEGAEDTWKKVLDGTLSGFSIGGEIRSSKNEFVKDAGRTVRFVEDFDLVELSLVDNPANQLANVESFQKNIFSVAKTESGSVTVKGMAVETKIESVFVCENHDERVITVKSDEDARCTECSNIMTNIGWFESNENRAEKVDEIVTKFYTPAEEAAPTVEGGVEMTKGNEASKETAKEVHVPNPGETNQDGTPVEDASPAAVEPVENDSRNPNANGTGDAGEAAEGEGVEKAELEPEAEKPETEDSEISKKFQELHEAVQTTLTKSHEETLEKVTGLQKQLDEFPSKFAELEKKIDEFGEKVEVQKQRVVELESSIIKMNRSGALKKSAELSPAERVVQKKSFWGGAFSD